MDVPLLLEEHLAVVDRVVRAIAHAGRLSAADAEDFRSEALLHLLADDCRVLRAFQGRSSLSTYLTVVLRRLWHDRCARRWGRWRPSAEARRLGALAIELERLVHRDGLTLDEALTAMRSTHGVDASTLRGLWQRLPTRTRRRRVSDEALAGVADGRPDVSDVRERRTAVAATSTVLQRAVAQLPAEDRRLLHLRFVEGASMADAARRLGQKQSAIYPRFTRLLRALRTALETEGLRAPEALQHVGPAVRVA